MCFFCRRRFRYFSGWKESSDGARTIAFPRSRKSEGFSLFGRSRRKGSRHAFSSTARQTRWMLLPTRQAAFLHWVGGMRCHASGDGTGSRQANGAPKRLIDFRKNLTSQVTQIFEFRNRGPVGRAEEFSRASSNHQEKSLKCCLTIIKIRRAHVFGRKK